jgi:hypothetical protein
MFSTSWPLMISLVEIVLIKIGTGQTPTRLSMLKLIMKTRVLICLKEQSILMQVGGLNPLDINNLAEAAC